VLGLLDWWGGFHFFSILSKKIKKRKEKKQLFPEIGMPVTTSLDIPPPPLLLSTSLQATRNSIPAKQIPQRRKYGSAHKIESRKEMDRKKGGGGDRK